MEGPIEMVAEEGEGPKDPRDRVRMGMPTDWREGYGAVAASRRLHTKKDPLFCPPPCRAPRPLGLPRRSINPRYARAPWFAITSPPPSVRPTIESCPRRPFLSCAAAPTCRSDIYLFFVLTRIRVHSRTPTLPPVSTSQNLSLSFGSAL